MASGRQVEVKGVIEVFDEIAWVYDRGRGAWYRSVKALLRDVSSPFLDVGAGTGAIACSLALDGVEVVAVDSAPSMVSVARRRALRKWVYALMHLVVAHLPLLPFRDGSFGSVTAIAVLHHLSSRERRVVALKVIKGLLREGGLAVLTVWYRYVPRNLFRAILSFLKGLEWGDTLVPWRHRGRRLYRFYHLYSLGEIVGDLRRAGIYEYEVSLWSPRGKLFKDNILVVFRRTR